MTERPLDLDAVQAFIRVAELGSFTRAAEAMRTTQSAVSLKLKRLEQRLDCRLVERTPRHVQLSARGEAFLEHARALLEVHDRAFAVVARARQRLTIGISDHVAGPELPALIARMNAQDCFTTTDVRTIHNHFAVKPTSSILTKQRSVNDSGEEIEMQTKGRHDPCVGIRAVPVGEAMMACVLADHWLRHRGQTGGASNS